VCDYEKVALSFVRCVWLWESGLKVRSVCGYEKVALRFFRCVRLWESGLKVRSMQFSPSAVVFPQLCASEDFDYYIISPFLQSKKQNAVCGGHAVYPSLFDPISAPKPLNRCSLNLMAKRWSCPVTGREGPEGCETSRLPHFLDSQLTDGGEAVSLTRPPPFTPRKIPGTHFC
jgi:hypothetical protein